MLRDKTHVREILGDQTHGHEELGAIPNDVRYSETRHADDAFPR